MDTKAKIYIAGHRSLVGSARSRMLKKVRDHVLFLEEIAAAIKKIERYASGEGFRERGKEDMVLKCRPIRDRVVNITTMEGWL